MPLPPRLVDYHRKNNQATQARWDSFAEHRVRVTALALEGPGQTLAVLGAGNCNDLDLPALAARFRAIHLVDLDEESLVRARDRQPESVRERLVLHAPVDLSGAFDRLAAFKGKPATAAEQARLVGESVQKILQALPGPFDVVLSACMLSQLMHSCYVALGLQHPQLHLMAAALGLAHLRSLAALVGPGGTGILVTDTISSETYALEELWADKPPLALLEEIDRTDRVLTGTGPTFLKRIFRDDPEVAPLATAPRLVEPWLWRFTEEMTFLVYALVFRRR
ncbi:MAG TPA: hypothetical protein VN914_01305 [Polyangia bacterium]|nr:hypothetical protein [Polyangia bacterium]